MVKTIFKSIFCCYFLFLVVYAFKTVIILYLCNNNGAKCVYLYFFLLLLLFLIIYNIIVSCNVVPMCNLRDVFYSPGCNVFCFLFSKRVYTYKYNIMRRWSRTRKQTANNTHVRKQIKQKNVFENRIS